jgi:hypothetical protein
VSYRTYQAHDQSQPLVPGAPVALDIEVWRPSMFQIENAVH